MAKDSDKLILHKCRNCNRTDRRAWNPTELPKCNHCESTMDPLEIRYKCLRCGHHDAHQHTRTGIACKACGFRIFVKPRRQGHKTLDAI